jgi:signal transduction histidine kinase/ligand-binding sensor domain-containing protein/DNA-binding response OmpR family regulator
LKFKSSNFNLKSTLLWVGIFSSIYLNAQTNDYQEFNNTTLYPNASMIYCFVQDAQKIVWLGTDKGLFSYDGYSIQSHQFSFKVNENRTNTKINCGLSIDADHLYLGSDNGMLIYNIRNDQYEANLINFPQDIRSLALNHQKLWIGTLQGLFRYSLTNHSIENISSQKNNGIPHPTIYSIIITHKKEVFVGTYNGLCFKTQGKTKFRKINLPVLSSKNSLLVNSLLEDTAQHCIWIGTEGYLFRYFPDNKRIDRIGDLDGNSIKSLALDADNNLLIGTDNGLYWFNKKKSLIRQVVHDSRYSNSLINNIIWSIYVDRDKNAWFGTDNGISMFKHNKNYRWIPISEITGLGEGNQFQTIFKDFHQNFWFGGTNGLILIDKEKRSYWFKMDNKRYPISHNRVRCIYETPDHQLWIATDGSINRFDNQSRTFIHYNIVDSTLTRNANWAYQVLEDKNGKLWIASCLGGIFVVNKTKLIENTSDPYMAEQNFYFYPGKNSLSDNYIIHIVSDLKGNIWALTYNNQLNKIDSKTGKVTKIQVLPGSSPLSNGNVYSLISDHEGIIWVGYNGGLARIDPRINKVQQINFEGLKNNRVRLLTEENNHIWIIGSTGTYVLNKKNFNIQYVNILNKDYSSSFYDSEQDQIYLGGVDGYVVFSPQILKEKSTASKVILTSFYVNDKAFINGIDYKGKSIRYLSKITLNYNQNNLSFECSDLGFSPEENPKFIYRLEGLQNDWRMLTETRNRISYTNLSPGEYTLLVGKANTEGKVQNGYVSMKIKINAPWYFNFWSKLLYFILFAGFLFWIYNYFHEKHLLKIERIEKEKSIELSKLKIDFFTNVSHEFKTPLSLIIGPLSKIIMDTKQPILKKQLSLVQQNALRLNELIQQVIGFERFDEKANTNIILSDVEFVEFAQGIFSLYETSFRNKNIQSFFNAQVEKMNVQVDILKVESILNNLISNALKYTNEGGKVHFEITIDPEEEHTIILKLTDNGIGIPSEELPYVFDRFFQSRQTKLNKDSSGIGLYLVKNFVELHHGKIKIESTEPFGTTVEVRLPVIKNETKIIESETKDEMSSIEKGPSENAILIVEDNIEVSQFLVEILSPVYHCKVAHNGKSGLDQLAHFKPDLIIVDVMMPVMDGIEFTHQLKKQKKRSDIPMIMLTAKDDIRTEEQSISLGINAFIAKPFDTNLLLMRVNQLIKSQQTLEQKIRLEQIAIPKPIEVQSTDELFLDNLTRLIEEKIADPSLNVNYLSEITGISTKQIYRKIKQLTSLTPVDYIRTIRLKKASMLLLQRKFSVAEIMYMVGFSNASYFTKCFQNQFGKTPKQYMESN